MLERRGLVVGALGLLCCLAIPAFAKVTHEVTEPRKVIPGLEVRMDRVRSDYRPKGAGDWVAPETNYQFRTTNGKCCVVTLDMDRTEMTNCKAPELYRETFANREGEWSAPGICIRQEGFEGYQVNPYFKFAWHD